MMVTHSDDDELSDQRFIYVPAKHHAPGSLRRIVNSTNAAYPRIVSQDRGPGYNTPSWPETPIIGAIPQVEHTYAYFDGNYGIMNEHNLMFGECTNGAKYEPDPVTVEEAASNDTHCRLFYSAELSRIALERCKTARKAVELMGSLIDTYGYFSTGETLLVADEHEGWVFEMCALPDEVYHSAWIAQRVPDSTVFVAANEFRIREIKEGNPDQFFSRHLLSGLKKVGWATPETGPVDWLTSVSWGEYNHPYYSLRRVWRIFDRVNPDLGLSPWVNGGSYTTDYPFSVSPKSPLSTQDVFALYRDHYEGTPFDLTKGVAAGPYGDPNRYIGPYDGDQNNVSTTTRPLSGAWERAISIFYQGYVYVAQTRPTAPELTKGIVWFGPDVASTTCFSPFPSRVTNLPLSYQVGDPQKFDRIAAWWAFDFVANWARLNYQRMYNVDIRPLQQILETIAVQRLCEWDDIMARENDAALLTSLCGKNAHDILTRWWELADMLIAKYSDGYINPPPAPPQNPPAIPIGYSADWLSITNYRNGPVTYDMPVTPQGTRG
ncbi:dipeptidase [Prodigiosinella confusarubida]|nr:C69 family dipeptidase [Serratia sp. ATCC 39006]